MAGGKSKYVKIEATPVGSEAAEQISLKDFFSSLKNCDGVNNIISINGKQYILDSFKFIA